MISLYLETHINENKYYNTTTDSENIALDIAKLLIDKKLSPCIQIIHNINIFI